MGGDAKKNIDPKPHVHGGLWAYAEDGHVSYAPATGKLTIRQPLFLLDGQTRAGGAKWAQEHGKVKDYTETVRIVVGGTREEYVRWYLTANMQQRKAPPQNMLLNIATLEGTAQNRKSWVGRHMATLASEAPFTIQTKEGFTRIVSFKTRDGGRLSAYTLYKAINFLLPPELNKEGDAEERKALAYAREAFKLYASIYQDVWGKVGEDGKLIHHDCYEFTMLVAFARVYKAAKAKHTDQKTVNDVMRRTWIQCGYEKGLPEGSGSGERAAISLAASEANLDEVQGGPSCSLLP